MKYVLACLHCGTALARTERVGDAEVTAVETHLRTEHADRLPAGRPLDLAEALGNVRVRMVD